MVLRPSPREFHRKRGAQWSQMKTQLTIPELESRSRHPISARRAAAARANGAKSRGPVTAQGKANSRRNSFRHGLRATTFPVDAASESGRLDLIAQYMDSLLPRSENERVLIEIMATAEWRQRCLWEVEQTVLNDKKVIPLLDLPRAYATGARVRDLHLRADGTPNLADASLGAAQ